MKTGETGAATSGSSAGSTSLAAPASKPVEGSKDRVAGDAARGQPTGAEGERVLVIDPAHAAGTTGSSAHRPSAASASAMRAAQSRLAATISTAQATLLQSKPRPTINPAADPGSSQKHPPSASTTPTRSGTGTGSTSANRSPTAQGSALPPAPPKAVAPRSTKLLAPVLVIVLTTACVVFGALVTCSERPLFGEHAFSYVLEGIGGGKLTCTRCFVAPGALYTLLGVVVAIAVWLLTIVPSLEFHFSRLVEATAMRYVHALNSAMQAVEKYKEVSPTRRRTRYPQPSIHPVQCAHVPFSPPCAVPSPP